MGIYFINIFSILVFALINKILKDSNHHLWYSIKLADLCTKAFIVLTSFQLFMLSSLKDLSVGFDTTSYLRIFNEISKLSVPQFINYNIETGYKVFNRIISFLYLDYRILIILISFFLFSILGFFLYKESKIPWLSFYLFITLGHFNFTLTIFRQSLAIFITIYAIKFVRENKFLKFVIAIFIASMFHQSALAFLIVYPFSKIKINKEYLTLIAFIGTTLFVLKGIIIEQLLLFYNRNQRVISGEGVSMFIMLFIILVAAIFLTWIFDKNNTEIQLYIHLLIIAVLFQVLALEMSIITRVVNYFSIYTIVLIPNVIYLIKNTFLKKMGIVTILILTFAYYVFLLIANGYGTVPYLFMW